MKNSTGILVVLLSAAATLFANGCNISDSKKPKLAVIIVVDQMRADHLSRFAGVYPFGFKRLLDEGAVFTNAHHDHAYTMTAVGHAAISTGVYPSRNGIVGNSWFDRKENKKVYCCEDTLAPLLGYPDEALYKGRSPLRMLEPPIGDWLKEVSPKSKVFGVSRKDRAAILSTGVKADGAYWYSHNDGYMITSEYYEKSYPKWVEEFNESRLVDTYFEDGWHKFADEEVYLMAREDTCRVEYDGKHTAFPHNFAEKSEEPDKNYYDRLQGTPFVDALILEFSKALVENEGLGEDKAPDILFVGCSAADALGHDFGPLSQESLDHFLRLDHYLGDFFTFLDERVGKENYITVLSSDHGVLPMPEELARRGYDSKRIPGWRLQADLRKAIAGVARELGISGSLVKEWSGTGLVIDYSRIDSAGVAHEKVNGMLVDSLKQIALLEDVYTKDELSNGTAGGRPYRQLYAHSFHPERTGDLFLRLKEFHLVHDSCGTSHGSPYHYDTHIPIVFCGPGVKKGTHAERVRTIDIAPTLAGFLGIDAPPDIDGTSLYETIQKN